LGRKAPDNGRKAPVASGFLPVLSVFCATREQGEAAEKMRERNNVR
ncbi:hypothetical protein A2U01_0114970, partial [Trifolium medium]|nr:hypothetical protein [Trifolium medium]